MGASTHLTGVQRKWRNFWLMSVAILSASAGSTLCASTRDEEDAYQRVLASRSWRTFSQQVSKNYVRPIKAGELEAKCKASISGLSSQDHTSLIERCIRAALKGLDSTSAYLNAAEWRAQRGDTPGKSAGIGLEMRAHSGDDGLIEIVSPIKGAPGEKAGLRAGDLIVSIDGMSTSSLSLAQSVNALRGEVGTRTTLQVRRSGTNEPLQFTVTREPIKAATVRSAKLLSAGVGYFRLLQFQDRTRNEVLADVARLEADNAGPLQSLVLDLRDCPGGLLSATVGLTALFVQPGSVIVRVSGQHAGASRVYRAVAGDYASVTSVQADEPTRPSLLSLRLVVLVNAKTGAGAEALAKALQELRKATVLGQPSAGLASIETILPLDFGTALKLTTGAMSSPKGTSWQGRGVEPDVLLNAGAREKGEFGSIPADANLMAAIARLRSP